MISNIITSYNSLCKLFEFSKFLSFKECRKQVIKCKFKSIKEYRENKKPNWPSEPDRFYNSYWLGWYDFLGKKEPKFLSFEDCKRQVVAFKFLSKKEYKKNTKHNWPKCPDIFYKKDWSSWYDFLGMKVSIEENKKILIAIAKKGDKKPKIKTSIGGKLYSYTYINSDCYDQDFTQHIKSIRPDWLVTQYDVAKQKKEKLLEMAKNGEPRPNKKNHSLGASLGTYTNKSQRGSYDPGFDKKIRKIRPDWFVPQTEKVNIKKNKLLELAKSGKPRPKYNTELGRFLGERTTKKRMLNDSFTKEIKKLRPDWFVTKAQLNKEKLIELAKNGAKRPNQKTEMGILFYSYIRRPSNCEFKKALKKLRPDWFVSRSEIANMKKKELIKIAKNGVKRPYGTSLGSCLCNYVGKFSGTYDPEFSRIVRKLRPDWFKK
jgi:hypothetical protein